MGLVSETRIVYVRSWDELPPVAEAGMKPEKKASVLLGIMFWMGMQGLSKFDWATEWFYAWLAPVCSRMRTCTHLGMELELDHISGSGFDVVGEEGERPVGSTNLDGVCRDTHGRYPRWR
jgi:hypothetical protein